MPAVSVIVPVYKVEPYIARCVRSLFGQTLQDMEFIFVDDCSPDKSMEILWHILKEEYPSRVSQVKVFRMPHNSGQARVRVQGISMATGDYVIHCDSDDMVDPDAYRVLYERAIHGQYDIVTCGFLEQSKGAWLKRKGKCTGVRDIISGKVGSCLWAKLVKYSIVEKSTIIPPGNMGEDMVLAIQYFFHAQHVGHLDRVCYYYYDCLSSITKMPGQEAAVSRWQSLYSNIKEIVGFLCSNHFYNEKDKEIVIFKYSCRTHLVPFLSDPYCYRLWRSSFPEINRYFVFIPGIPFETKFWFVLILLNLYLPWKKVTNFLRRRSK